MKIVKYALFTILFLLNLAILYIFLRGFHIYLINADPKVLTDSRFENARLIYVSYYAMTVLATLLILSFSAKTIKTAPLVSFGLLAIPIVYKVIDIYVISIF